MPPNVQISPPPVDLVMPFALCSKFAVKRTWATLGNNLRGGESLRSSQVQNSRKSWNLQSRLTATQADLLWSFFHQTKCGQKLFWFVDPFETVPRFTQYLRSPLLGETTVTWDVSRIGTVSRIAILTGDYSSNWRTDKTLSAATVFVAPTPVLQNTDPGLDTGFIIRAGLGFWLVDVSDGKSLTDPQNVLDYTGMSVVTSYAGEGAITYGPALLLATADNPCYVAPGKAPGFYSARFDVRENGLTREYTMARHNLQNMQIVEAI